MSTSIRVKLEESNEGHLNKLIKALDMLSVLEKRHQDLLREYETLAEKYLYTKKCSIEAVWGYIPMKSRSTYICILPFLVKILMCSLFFPIGSWENLLRCNIQ